MAHVFAATTVEIFEIHAGSFGKREPEKVSQPRSERVGLEAGPLSQWLHAGLVAAGFDTVLLETGHAKAALSAMTVKTDRRDARGIAQLLRSGRYWPVHAKSVSAQEVRALRMAR